MFIVFKLCLFFITLISPSIEVYSGVEASSSSWMTKGSFADSEGISKVTMDDPFKIVFFGFPLIGRMNFLDWLGPVIDEDLIIIFEYADFGRVFT